MKKLPTFNEFLTESNSSKGTYSYKEMKDFLERIIQYMAPYELPYRGPNIQIPYDRNSSSSIYDIEKLAIKKLEEFDKKYQNDKGSYYIWNYDFSNERELNKRVKIISSQRVDLTSLFQNAASNTGKLYKFSIGFTSDAQNEFGRLMAKGDFGPLD